VSLVLSALAIIYCSSKVIKLDEIEGMMGGTFSTRGREGECIGYFDLQI
jgi:hypothetical protein